MDTRERPRSLAGDCERRARRLCRRGAARACRLRAWPHRTRFSDLRRVSPDLRADALALVLHLWLPDMPLLALPRHLQLDLACRRGARVCAAASDGAQYPLV